MRMTCGPRVHQCSKFTAMTPLAVCLGCAPAHPLHPASAVKRNALADWWSPPAPGRARTEPSGTWRICTNLAHDHQWLREAHNVLRVAIIYRDILQNALR